MTVRQILANNSLEEEISIIVSSKAQYDEFCELLNKYGYKWASGMKMYGDDKLNIDMLETEIDYSLLILSLHSNIQIVTYLSFFDKTNELGFNQEEFLSGCQLAFQNDNSAAEPLARVYKPYLTLKEEIKAYGSDYAL